MLSRALLAAAASEQGRQQQRHRAGTHVAFLFWLTLVLIVAGLVYFSVIGLSHH
jgi:hypothetical protein